MRTNAGESTFWTSTRIQVSTSLRAQRPASSCDRAPVFRGVRQGIVMKLDSPARFIGVKPMTVGVDGQILSLGQRPEH